MYNRKKNEGFFKDEFETPNRQLQIVKLQFSQGQPFVTGQPLAHSFFGEAPLPVPASHIGSILKPEKVIFRNINEYIQ